MTAGLIEGYFPSLSARQKEQFSMLKPLYEHWNSMINVISRKDMDNFTIHHVLHSLAIAKLFSLPAGARILDVGTGGGFPGIPLAIMFPETGFSLLDATGKKIKVVTEVSEKLGLKNITPLWKRVEDEKGSYDYVISRAVTRFPEFVNLVAKRVSKTIPGKPENGIIYLKGGELDDELGVYREHCQLTKISEFFSEPFFETKKIIFLPQRFL